MAEKSAVLESKDGKGGVQLSARTFDPHQSGKMSTPTKERDGDQTPTSVRADMENMDELIQRLSKSTRNDGVRKAESLVRRVFMHRREVQEDMLLQYYHFENPHVEKDDKSVHKDDNPLRALARQQRARNNWDQSKNIAQDAKAITGLPMLSPSGMPMICWSILILIVDGIYTALWVPVEAAFDTPHEIGTVTGTMDFCVGVILCIDIFLRFHTPIELTSSFMTYLLKQGPSVAHLYVRHGTFVLDVLASVPLVVLPFVGADKATILVVLVLRILRLVRVHKIINMLFYIQMISVSGASGWRMILGNIVSTLYTICVMINFCACLWYYVGNIGYPGVEGWLAQEYKFQGPPDEVQCEEYQNMLINEGRDDLVELVECSALWFDKQHVGFWLVSIYFVVVTLTTVGYGDITPSSSVEVVTAMVIMIVGLGIFASILGKVADIMANGSRSAKQEQEVRKKLTDIQQWMADLSFTNTTRSSVLRFYAEDWTCDGEEHYEILQELPNDVAAACIWDLVHYDLQQVPLFQNLRLPASPFFERDPNDADEGAKALASYMKPKNATRGTHFTRQGGPVEHIYFLQRGQVEVTNLGETVAMLHGPTVFGEAALLRDVSEPAKVRLSGYRTYTACKIWAISLEDLQHLSVIMPYLKSGLMRGLKQGVFRKLLLLDLKRLELVKMFLYFMKIEQGEEARKGLEKMQRKMHSAVDMALVTILAHYDKEYRKASRAGHLLTTAASTPRVGGFLPHSMQEDKEREDLSAMPSTLPSAAAAVCTSPMQPMASGSMQPMPSGSMSKATAGHTGVTQTHVVWGPSVENSTMGSAMSTIDATPNADATPTAAEMSDVLEKFDEAAADLEKVKQQEKQAREEREAAQNRGEGRENEEQSSPKRAFAAAAAVAAAGTSSPRKAPETASPRKPPRWEPLASGPSKGASTVATADVTLSLQGGPNSRAATTVPAGSQVGSLDTPENGGASGSDDVVDPPGGLSILTPKKNLKELSFAGNLMRASDSADANSNSKKLNHSNRLRGDTAGNVSKQESVGMPPVAKDPALGRVFSFPRMPGEGEVHPQSLEANKDLMSDMVRKGQDGGQDPLDEKLQTTQETFNDMLDRMSGTQMVLRAIEDITAYGEGQDGLW